jgi:hypothetical protein
MSPSTIDSETRGVAEAFSDPNNYRLPFEGVFRIIRCITVPQDPEAYRGFYDRAAMREFRRRQAGVERMARAVEVDDQRA